MYRPRSRKGNEELLFFFLSCLSGDSFVGDLYDSPVCEASIAYKKTKVTYMSRMWPDWITSSIGERSRSAEEEGRDRVTRCGPSSILSLAGLDKFVLVARLAQSKRATMRACHSPRVYINYVLLFPAAPAPSFSILGVASQLYKFVGSFGRHLGHIVELKRRGG